MRCFWNFCSTKGSKHFVRTMPVNIQKVLVCDAVDESCIQLLKQNGIQVRTHSLCVYAVWFCRIMYTQTQIHSQRAHLPVHTNEHICMQNICSIRWRRPFLRACKMKRNEIQKKNQPVFKKKYSLNLHRKVQCMQLKMFLNMNVFFHSNEYIQQVVWCNFTRAIHCAHSFGCVCVYAKITHLYRFYCIFLLDWFSFLHWYHNTIQLYQMNSNEIDW